MKCEVAIPKDEMRKAYTMFLALSEIEKSSVSGEVVKAKRTDDEPPTEEEIKVAKARAVLNTVEFDDDDSLDNFNLSSVGSIQVPGSSKMDTDDHLTKMFNSLAPSSSLSEHPQSPEKHPEAVQMPTPPEVSSTTEVTKNVDDADAPTTERLDSVDIIITGDDVQLETVHEMSDNALDCSAEISRNQDEETTKSMFADVFTSPSKQATINTELNTFAVTNFPTLGIDDLAKTPPYGE
jgi:hypothetical protein